MVEGKFEVEEVLENDKLSSNGNKSDDEDE
jgi:hypothetical protein